MKGILTILIIGLVVVVGYAAYLTANMGEEGTFGTTGLYTNISLVGSGYDDNSGIASATDQPTNFRFATSTDTTYWNTASACGISNAACNQTDLPMFGATATKAFLVDTADSVTFYIWTKTGNSNNASTTIEFAVSPDNDCETMPLSSNSAHWYPATNIVWGANSTSTANTAYTYAAGTTASSTVFVATASEISFNPITIINDGYKCMMVKAYNASTTMGNYLNISASFKE